MAQEGLFGDDDDCCRCCYIFHFGVLPALSSGFDIFQYLAKLKILPIM
jgi:hypothetical protein